MHRFDKRLRLVAVLLAFALSALPVAAELDGPAGPAGPELHGLLTVDLSLDFGSDRRRRTTARGLFDLGLDWEIGGKAAPWRGRLFAFVHALRGRDGSSRLGDIQVYSNIDNPEEFEQVAEVGYEWVRTDRLFGLRAGRLDANATFALAEHGLPFVHSSAGFSPTILTMVTYPDPDLGVELFGQAIGGLEWKAGLFRSPRDGDPFNRGRDPRLALAEAGWRWRLGRGGRLALGYWRDSAHLPAFDGSLERGSDGPYLVAEQSFGADRDLYGLFLQWGRADRRVGEIEAHLGLGLTRQFPPGRARIESCGAMVSRVDLSDDPASGLTADETAVEGFCAFAVHRDLTLKPNLQWIRHPGGDPARPDGWVLLLRLEYAFDASLDPG